MQAKAQKFKAIALCFFAFAALDAWVVASAPTLVADSAVGTYVMVLAQAFLSIDWTRCSIEIALDGSTRIVRRRPEQQDDINIWLESSQCNAAHNVTHEFVATCRTALNNVTSRLPEALSRALQEQGVPDKDKRLKRPLSAPTTPSAATRPPPRPLPEQGPLPEQRPSPAAPLRFAPPPPLKPPPSPAPTASPVVAASAAPSPAPPTYQVPVPPPPLQLPASTPALPYLSSGGSMHQVPVPFDASQRPVPPSRRVQPAQGTLMTPWSSHMPQPPPLPAPTVTASPEGSPPPAPPLQQPPLTEESLAVGEFAVYGGARVAV